MVTQSESSKPTTSDGALTVWARRLALFTVCIAALFFLIAFVPRWFASDEKEVRPADVASEPITAATTEVVNRQVTTGVSCLPWRHEKQTCTFDALPTAGFGQAEHGAKFCVDMPYGSDHTYRLQRWDSDDRDFTDMVKGKGSAKTVVGTTRFVGNLGDEAVTVTYWLGDDESCETAKVAQSNETVVTESRNPVDTKVNTLTKPLDEPEASLYTANSGFPVPSVTKPSPQAPPARPCDGWDALVGRTTC